VGGDAGFERFHVALLPAGGGFPHQRSEEVVDLPEQGEEFGGEGGLAQPNLVQKTFGVVA